MSQFDGELFDGTDDEEEFDEEEEEDSDFDWDDEDGDYRGTFDDEEA